MQDNEISLHDVEPFIVDAPPPQPAASKRKGTKYIHPNLPQPPFTIAMVGPRKTGKSVTLRNMLDPKKKGSYGAAFRRNNIIFFSPTHEYDKTVTSLNLVNVYGPPTKVTTLVDSIEDQQETYKQQDDMADVLLVLEDCTIVPDAWPVIERLGYAGRHRGIHTLAVAHKVTTMSRGVRTQLQQWMLFKPHEESEAEWILYLFSRQKTRHIWQRAFGRAWNMKEYNFVYIDFERRGREEIYRNGFNEPLFTPEEIAEIEAIENGVSVKKPDDELTEEEIQGRPPKEDKAPAKPSTSKKRKTTETGAVEPAKKRGRPTGSKNKPK
jgi:hypothetical protein